MKIRQDTLIVAALALLVGILVGGVAGGQGLFGTAIDNSNADANVEVDPSRFYMVKFEDAQGWLQTFSGDNLEQPLTEVAGLANAINLGEYFVQTEASVDTVLFSLQNALLKEDGVDQNVANAVTTCIGVDSNPYSLTGPGLYVYVSVPDGIEIPDEFLEGELNAPQENSITWAASCVKGSNSDK